MFLKMDPCDVPKRAFYILTNSMLSPRAHFKSYIYALIAVNFA